MPEQEHERIGAIVDMEEFPAWCAGSPDRDLAVAGERRSTWSRSTVTSSQSSRASRRISADPTIPR
jgi:hypothetical protein